MTSLCGECVTAAKGFYIASSRVPSIWVGYIFPSLFFSRNSRITSSGSVNMIDYSWVYLSVFNCLVGFFFNFMYNCIGQWVLHHRGEGVEDELEMLKYAKLSWLFFHTAWYLHSPGKPRDGQRNCNDRKCIVFLFLLLGSSAFSVVLFLLCNFHFLPKV